MAERKVKKSRVVTRKSAVQSAFPFSRSAQPVFASNGAKQPKYLTDYRSQAWSAYEAASIPAVSEEPWRRTSLRDLQAGSFAIPTPEQAAKLPPIPNALAPETSGDEYGGRAVLSPQGVDVELDDDLVSQGVIFTSLEEAALHHPQVLERVLGKLVSPSEDKFSSMTAAFAGKGIVLYVPAGVRVEKPLHSLFWGPGLSLAHFSHILVHIDDRAEASLVHEYQSPTEDGGQTLHSGIVELHVGENARLNFVEYQSWGRHVWNFSHERARVARDGHLDWVFGAVGSRLTKNFTEIDLVGQGAVGRMSGFYFTDGDQHLDHDTQQNHHAPNTTSDLLFKGALDDRSRSVWQGMIYVAPDAQKTDGYQSNPNLVLSKGARADSIPGLEILADDVRCTHGATVGKIDPEEVFYLQARGITADDAQRLIVEGFFDPILQRIHLEGLRRRFRQSIVDKLD
ncbi:MAG: Fe-S cluster assembly protein SufD [Anaerolineae bacterium]|nr:Fe-S cluster assembly protein SufD [Anaerolineae bacterium]